MSIFRQWMVANRVLGFVAGAGALHTLIGALENQSIGLAAAAVGITVMGIFLPLANPDGKQSGQGEADD